MAQYVQRFSLAGRRALITEACKGTDLEICAALAEARTAVEKPGPRPLAKRLGRTAHLRRNRDDRRPLRFVPALGVQGQPHCPFPKLRGSICLMSHRSSLSRFGASGKPGAVHAGQSLVKGEAM